MTEIHSMMNKEQGANHITVSKLRVQTNLGQYLQCCTACQLNNLKVQFHTLESTKLTTTSAGIWQLKGKHDKSSDVSSSAINPVQPTKQPAIKTIIESCICTQVIKSSAKGHT